MQVGFSHNTCQVSYSRYWYWNRWAKWLHNGSTQNRLLYALPLV